MWLDVVCFMMCMLEKEKYNNLTCVRVKRHEEEKIMHASPFKI